MSALTFDKPGLWRRVLLNPLVQRELRVACRDWKLVATLTAYLLLQAIIFAIWVWAARSTDGTYENPTNVGSGLFITMSIVMMAVVVLVFPAFSSTAIAGEHEKKSFDLLLLTPLAPWEIALGKFLAAGVQASVFLVATVPMFAMASLYGGIETSEYFLVLWVLILLSILVSFIGVYASSLVEKSFPAIMITYAFAIVFGIVLLVVFLALIVLSSSFGRAAALAFPVVSMFIDPSTSEGLFYAGAMTTLCTVYCAYFFINTTNRLKPSAHNRSTSLRVFWSVVAFILPGVFVAYFLSVRTPTHTIAMGALITALIYVFLMMVGPTVTAPAEAPVPSRRVRREMARLPAAFLSLGGKLFYPGSARGVLHAALVATVAMSLMIVVCLVCFERQSVRLEDSLTLADRFEELKDDSGLRFAVEARDAAAPALAEPATIEERRTLVLEANRHEFYGLLALGAVLLVALLALGQMVWRMSLSGFARNVSAMLGGALLLAWVLLPGTMESMVNTNPLSDRTIVAHFSPWNAGTIAYRAGLSRAHLAFCERQGVTNESLARQRDNLDFSLWLFLGCTAGVAAVLAAWNTVSHLRVVRAIHHATGEGDAARQTVHPEPQAAAPSGNGQPPAETPAQPASAPADPPAA